MGKLPQMLTPMLMLGTDMVLDMDMAIDMDMVDTTDTDIPIGHTDTTERGLLMLSQQLSQMPKPMLMLGTDITDMVLDMDIAVDTMVDTTDIPTGHTDTTERGLLMLSQRPSLSLQLMLTTSDTMVLAMDTLDMDTDTPSQAHCGVPVPDTTGDRCHAF